MSRGADGDASPRGMPLPHTDSTSCAPVPSQIVLAASAGLRRAVLAAALLAAAVEVALFLLLWRLAAAVDLAADPRAALLVIALGSALTLQAMAVVGIAWVAVAMSRTVLVADSGHVSLEHPWRGWHGPYSAIARAWVQNGWLAIEVRGQWRRWYVRVAGAHPAALARIRGALEAGGWLEGRAMRAHLARTTLPIVLGATGVAGLLLVWVLAALDRFVP
jgi:hypothetical protein